MNTHLARENPREERLGIPTLGVIVYTVPRDLIMYSTMCPNISTVVSCLVTGLMPTGNLLVARGASPYITPPFECGVSTHRLDPEGAVGTIPTGGGKAL